MLEMMRRIKAEWYTCGNEQSIGFGLCKWGNWKSFSTSIWWCEWLFPEPCKSEFEADTLAWSWELSFDGLQNPTEGLKVLHTRLRRLQISPGPTIENTTGKSHIAHVWCLNLHSLYGTGAISTEIIIKTAQDYLKPLDSKWNAMGSQYLKILSKCRELWILIKKINLPRSAHNTHIHTHTHTHTSQEY